MPLPKNKILQATSSLARTNDWKFKQTFAPIAGPGSLTEEVLARISPDQLPKSEATKITGNVAGYEISQQGRTKTSGSLTFKAVEASDGTTSNYFESLKGLNNPRDAAGELTGVQIAEADKEGEYSITLQGPDGSQVKKYILKRAVVSDVETTPLENSEQGSFVELTVTVDYKDFVIMNANNTVIA